MALASGDRLGNYEILVPIGKGGMGEVYRAKDTKLDRDVAIKILPESFAHDPERIARFEREARVLAALNHPNIAQIYGLEERALIMELVEGPTLAERIAKGALPLEEALGIAKQIAEALEAAHEKGITHRDLKPANVKITPAGTVKVLDFGLATAAQASTAEGNPSNSPTLTFDFAATRVGMILGTAAYMSPEQAVGKPVDRRGDIWSFGVVLFEMLTGRRLFEGETISHVLADVIKGEIDLSKLPSSTPRPIRELLKRCLDRDLKNRLQWIGEARVQIQKYLAEPSGGAQVREREEARTARLPWAMAVALATSTLALAFLHFREKPLAAPEPMQFQIIPPEKSPQNDHVSISPDGRQVLFSGSGPDGREHLWLRDLNTLEARPLSGAIGSGTPALNPFWSADSRFIAFSVDGKLKKMASSGGPAQTLCDTADGDTGGGAWNREGVIIFGSNANGLFRVSSTGGVPSPVTILDPARHERFHRRPVFLPDGRHFLYIRSSDDPENTGIFVGSLDVKPDQQSRKRLLPGQIGVVYAPTADAARGYVLFLQEDALMAQAFDMRRLELTGEPAPVAEQVGSNLLTIGYFSASGTGTLVYLNTGLPNSRLVWFNRQGKVIGPASESGKYLDLKLSPDGTRVAAARLDGKNVDIWLLEFTRGTSTRLTFDPAIDNFPIWSPDGSQIVFGSARKASDLYRKPSSGAGEEELLLKSTESKYPTDWSSDGRFLLYTVDASKTRSDIWVLPLDGDRKAAPFLATPFIEGHARFSPDGHWVVYQSNESGRMEVYVRPFSPSAGGKWMVSSGGGPSPAGAGMGRSCCIFRQTTG